MTQVQKKQAKKTWTMLIVFGALALSLLSIVPKKQRIKSGKTLHNEAIHRFSSCLLSTGKKQNSSADIAKCAKK